jgi:hypothetical protein
VTVEVTGLSYPSPWKSVKVSGLKAETADIGIETLNIQKILGQRMARDKDTKVSHII